jgi:hypothetical protein
VLNIFNTLSFFNIPYGMLKILSFSATRLVTSKSFQAVFRVKAGSVLDVQEHAFFLYRVGSAFAEVSAIPSSLKAHTTVATSYL